MTTFKNIPTRQFEVRQQPPTGLYILAFFGTFLLSGVICLPLAAVAGQYGLIFFPFGPPVLTAVVVFGLLHAPCTVTVEEAGLTIVVKRATIGIPARTRFWPWSQFYQFDYYVNRGTFLTLTLSGDAPVFTWGQLKALRDYLREHFPEKEKKRRWGLF